MRRKLALGIGAVLAAASLTVLLAGPVGAQLSLPMQVSGSVVAGGVPVPTGTVVSARLALNGDVLNLKSTTTGQTSGRGSNFYVFNIPADDESTTTIREGFVEGETVLLYVGESQGGSVVFENGGSKQVDLSVASLPATPTPTPVGTATPTPAPPPPIIIIPPGDTTPPAVPTGLSATAGDGQVELSWDADLEELVTYFVERSETGPTDGFTRIANLLGTSYTDTGLTNGTTYYYRIVAVDQSDNESDPSGVVSATPTAPPTPTPTATVTPTPSPTPTATPGPSPTPAVTPGPTATATPGPSPTPSATPSVIATATATVTPTALPTLAAVSLSELSLSADTVNAGEPVTVTVLVSNPSEQAAGYAVTLQVDGQIEGEASGTLDPRTSRRLSFNVVRSSPGTYRVSIGDLSDAFTVRGAEIVLEDFSISPRVVGVGDSVEISAHAVNRGGAPGEYEFSLIINGATEATTSGLLLRGASVPILFTVSRSVPGTYQVGLGVQGGVFQVLAPAVDVTVTDTIAVGADATATDAEGNAVDVVEGGSAAVAADEVDLPVALPEGATLGAFTDPESGITVEEGTVTIPLRDEEGNVQMNLVVETEGLTGTGTSAHGTVTSLSLESPPQEVDLSGEDETLGQVAMTVKANLNNLPPDAGVRMTPKATLPAAALSGFELQAQQADGTIAGVGGAIEVETTNLPNGAGGVGTVTVCIAVSPAWVDQNTGNAFRFAHQTTDPVTGEVIREMLDAQPQAQPDAQGRTVFCAESEGFSSYALLAVAPRSADIQFRNLLITPSVTEPGGVVGIEVDLMNAGGLAATQSVVLEVNGEPVKTLTVTVVPGETVTVAFLQRPEEEGVFSVAVAGLQGAYEVTTALSAVDVRLTDLRVSSSEVEPGEPVTVSVVVENQTDRRGKYDVVLTVNNVPEEIQGVALAAGAKRTVSFQIVKEAEGVYEVAVETASTSFRVERAPQPAAIEIIGLAVSPAEVTAGDEVTVSVTLENTGDVAGTYEAVVRVGTTQEVRRTVELGPQTQRTIEIRLLPEEEGTLEVRAGARTAMLRVLPKPPAVVKPEAKPAALAVQSVRVTPERVAPGEAVDVQVAVSNTGGEEGSLTIVVRVDGRQEATRDVTVGPGEIEIVTFQVTSEESGSHTVEVDGQSAAFEVEEAGGVPIGLVLALILLAVVVVVAAIVVLVRRRGTRPEEGDTPAP